MEEDKKIKRKKVFKMIYKIISYTIICILMAIAAFLIFYVISGKIAQKQGKKPLFGLYTIISPSMTGTLNVYDVAFTMRIDTDKLKEGDIITFYSTNSFFGGTPITHRIIEVVNVPNSGKMFRVKGDANPKADEEKVIPSNVVGKVMFKIPQLGRVQFFLASKGGWIIAIMIPALVIISYDIYKIFRLFLLKSKLLSMENEHGNI
ncbi:MAG: signal peptidase I [Mollicutes bacterium]|nr:signal peptidase I [Mollicutes bacterium]